MNMHFADRMPILLLATAISVPTMAEDSKDGIDAIQPYINLRYRYEFVDQDGIDKHANASTLQAKVGAQTGTWHGFSVLAEAEAVLHLGSDRFFDSNNGKTQYPTVLDPEMVELNQLYLDYTGLEDTLVRLGRQGINLDNQRFIGTVGWRQNDQTYDAVLLKNSSIEGLTALYSYVGRVLLITDPDLSSNDPESDHHLINLSYSGFSFGTLTGYAYLLDYQEYYDNNSSDTFGLRLAGTVELDNGYKLPYELEYAHQSDAADNPIDYSADYYHLAAGITKDGLMGRAGYEVLGSDGGNAGFRTPLATLHKFNGWADKFLSTPDNGLEDIYIGAGYMTNADNPWFNAINVAAFYHWFGANEGGDDYGEELNLVISKPFDKYIKGSLKYAAYNADDHATDTNKFWATLEASF
jgi:hypothetical protein